MKNFFAVAPGVIWVAIIAFLVFIAQWATQYFGNVTWVAALVGLITLAIVPTLKILFGGAPAPAEGRGLNEVTPERSKLSRWFL